MLQVHVCTYWMSYCVLTKVSVVDWLLRRRRRHSRTMRMMMRMRTTPPQTQTMMMIVLSGSALDSVNSKSSTHTHICRSTRTTTDKNYRPQPTSLSITSYHDLLQLLRLIRSVCLCVSRFRRELKTILRQSILFQFVFVQQTTSEQDMISEFNVRCRNLAGVTFVYHM